jgi:type I restriction enzyme, S subunit
MKLDFDITTAEYTVIRDILERLLPPDAKVWVFGSRAKGTARFNSDLDLAIESKAALAQSQIFALKEAFDDAPLSFRVDIVDLAQVDAGFRKIIDGHRVPFPMAKSANMPRLRFPEFKGDWVRKPLSAAWQPKGKRNYDNSFNKEDVLSVSGDRGIVNQIEHLGRSYAGAVVDNYHVVETGDIVYTKSPLKANPFGIIKANKGPAGIVSTLYAVYEVEPENDPYFWDRYFELDDRTNGYLMPLVHIGAKNDMKINNERVLIDPVYIPSFPEQKKIAAFLGVVDAKIAGLRAQVEGLETYKRGLMQALFSQTLRFTKPDGTAFPDWEEKKLGEVATRCKMKNTNFEYMRVLTNSAVQGVIDQGDYFDKDIANSENLGGYYIVKKGDFVYNPRISVTAPVGPVKRNDVGDGVMSPLYTVFRFNEADSSFFNTYFQTTFWHDYMKSVANYGARHDRMAISSGDFMDLPLPFPHPDEQQKIADALSTMDAKIQAVAAQVSHMETFKQGLLQQMFV